MPHRSRFLPTLHSIVVSSLVLAILVFSGCKKDEPAAEAAKPTPPNPLLEAAKGEYSGPYGKLSFRDDGSARFEIQNCGYETLEPGIIKMSPSSTCTSEVYEGKLEVNPLQLGIMQENQMTYLFGAYVDEGKLHLGIGEVFELNEENQGSLAITPLRTLHLGDPCKLEDFMEDGKMIEVACAFIERAGRKLFEFERQDNFDKSKLVKDAYVHLPALRLLVSPNLVEMAFSRP